MSRTIAIGDIHGCADALHALLAAIEPTQDDTIVTLGDYVDRGMQSDVVIETLINLVTDCRLVPLIGNHEIMMYKGIQNGGEDFEFWFQHGGNSTLASYGGRVQNIPQHHLAFLSHCVRFFETDQHFFVHANYQPEIPLNEQPDDTIFWQHVNMFPPGLHSNGKIAVVGHTPQHDGEILDFGYLKCIDTFCYGDQWLTALDATSGHYWQANNQGKLRTGQLEDQEELH
jgi:serine/threonine protein phosphatase 1